MGVAPWGEIQGGSCTLKPIFPNPAAHTYSIISFSLPHHSGKDILKTNGEIRLLDISREGEEGVAISLLYPLQGGQGIQHPLHGAALPTPGCPQSHWCVTGDQQLCTGNTPERSSPSPPTHFGVEKHLMAGCHRGVPIPHCGIYLPSMTSTPVPWENTPLPSARDQNQHPGAEWMSGTGCTPSLDMPPPHHKPRTYRWGESGSKQVLATSVNRVSQQSPSSKSSNMLLHSMWQMPSRRFQEKQRPGRRQSPPS